MAAAVQRHDALPRAGQRLVPAGRAPVLHAVGGEAVDQHDRRRPRPPLRRRCGRRHSVAQTLSWLVRRASQSRARTVYDPRRFQRAGPPMSLEALKKDVSSAIDAMRDGAARAQPRDPRRTGAGAGGIQGGGAAHRRGREPRHRRRSARPSGSRPPMPPSSARTADRPSRSSPNTTRCPASATPAATTSSRRRASARRWRCRS